MKKSTLVAILIVMLLVLLSACSTSSVDEENPFWGRMRRYPVDVGCNVYVDKVTGVCYFQYSSGYGGGITVMLDSNGYTLTYMGE